MRTGLPGFLDHIAPLSTPTLPVSFLPSTNIWAATLSMHSARCCTPLAVCCGSRGSRHLQMCLDPKQCAPSSLLSGCSLWCQVSSLVRLTSYKPASQLPLPVVSGLGSLSRLSRGCGGECSGKGVVCGGGGVIPQLVWRFVFAFAYGGRNGIGFIFLRFLSFLCLDCGLSNQAKKKKKKTLDWTLPEANICVQDLDHKRESDWSRKQTTFNPSVDSFSLTFSNPNLSGGV